MDSNTMLSAWAVFFIATAIITFAYTNFDRIGVRTKHVWAYLKAKCTAPHELNDPELIKVLRWIREGRVVFSAECSITLTDIEQYNYVIIDCFPWIETFKIEVYDKDGTLEHIRFHPSWVYPIACAIKKRYEAC